MTASPEICAVVAVGVSAELMLDLMRLKNADLQHGAVLLPWRRPRQLCAILHLWPLDMMPENSTTPCAFRIPMIPSYTRRCA